ncbi:MAG: sulfatase [Akkermansiaceae bacterium]|nr:sulfatase [Akkermansiaceae bacterium]
MALLLRIAVCLSMMKPPVFLTILTSLLIQHSPAGELPAGRPNILFFLVDDMGWQETSVPFHTEPTKLNTIYQTPAMVKLASEGLVFTNAYACAVCSPTRVSLMTGQNAARHRVTCWTLIKDKSPERENKILQSSPWNLNGLQPVGSTVPKSVAATTLPELLRKAGYRTIHAGKAHFGAKDTPGSDPKNLGFDVNIAGHYAGGPGSYHGDKNFSAAWRKAGHLWDVPGLEKYHGQKINLTEAITREVIAELENTVAMKQPFYLYMSHYTVHAPWEDDRRFIEKYQGKGLPKQQATLASMIEGMDKSLGDLMQTLQRLGVADNTIVVFMSDNGSPRQCQRNLPLRGHKITAYEGGSRVPLIVKWPGVTGKNLRTDTPMIIEDVFPTFLEMAGVPVPRDIPVDGKSLVPILKNPATRQAERTLFWHYPNFYDQPAFSSVRQGDWKLIYWHANQKLALYNLKDDLGEKNDLSQKHPEKTSRLAKVLGKHLKETDAVMPVVKSTGKPVPLPGF